MHIIQKATLPMLMLLATCLLKSTAQVNFIWVNGIGSISSDIGQAVAVDKQNNIYVTGQFSGNTDFDPGPDSDMIYKPVGDEDIFIAKYDPSGAYLWAIRIGGPNNEKSFDITVDDSGYVYITGTFWGTCDFDPGPGTFAISANGYSDAFFAKYDPTGVLVWAKQIGGQALDNGRAIVAGNDGFIYITGDFGDAVDFDANAGTAMLTVNGMQDIFITKYSTGGNYIWAKKIGLSHKDDARDIALDAVGNIYISGYFSGTTNFDPAGAAATVTSTGNGDGFIAKYTNNGNYLWAQTLGGTGDDYTMSLAVDASGTAFTIGYFTDTASFGSGLPALISDGSQDIFIAKYTATGTPLWAKKMGGTSFDQGWNIALGKQNTIYITGRFNSAVIDFDPGAGVHNLYAVGGIDGYISKYDSSGNYLWVCGIGAAVADAGYGIAIDTAENIYVTGLYSDTLRTNTSSGLKTNIATGLNDIFLLRLYDGCRSFVYHTEVACDSFLFNNHTYTSSGIYTDTFTNSAGCDSIVSLTLTINQSTTNNIIAHYCDSASINGMTYTNSGTYTHTYTSSSGCDSTVVYLLSIGTSDHTTLTDTACSIYRLNDSISYTVSGTYTHNFTNKSGCDSLITLHLTIYNPAASITRGEDTLTANAADNYQWIDCNNGNVIAGATTRSYVVTAIGNYKVAISLNGCTDTSDCIAVTATSTFDPLYEEALLQVSPNPAHDELIVRLGTQLNNTSYGLYTATGIKVAERNGIKGNVFRIDLSGYAPGVYLLVVKDDKGWSRRIKVVKQ